MSMFENVQNVNQNLKNSLNKLATLLLICNYDSSEDVEFTTHLFKLFSQKLSYLHIRIDKCFFITKHNYDDIIAQTNELINEASTQVDRLLLFASTTQSHRQLIFKLIEDISDVQFRLKKVILIDYNYNWTSNCQTAMHELTGIDRLQKDAKTSSNHFPLISLAKNIFVIDYDSLFFNLALLDIYLLKSIKSQRNEFIFEFQNKIDYLAFETEIKRIFELENNIDLLNDFKNEYFSLECNESNYCFNRVKIVLSRKQDEFRSIFSSLINKSYSIFDFSNNMIDADYYVYDFEYVAAFLMEHLINRSEDIKFLLSRINYDLFIQKLKDTIKIIEESFKKYNHNQLCLSFNGGKDSCVVLYLYYAIATRLEITARTNVLLIDIKDQFDEMNFFISKTLKSFYGDSLNLIVLSDVEKSIKENLNTLKAIRPELTGIFMGVRRSDGSYFQNMQAFAPTDSNWPSYMRINPLLEWTYSEVWFFIRLLKLPYCSLYDQGYTSLDSTTSTLKNNFLLKEDGQYLPAYLLENQESERCSRKKSK
jgi:3'-phosphoadenosine 5'-phosphosulfate sulfotransferase (PAPS reductase)/FAD synthetase